MASSREPRLSPQLQHLRDTESHTFQAPSKCINDGDDLSFFLSSTAYRDLTTWLVQLNRSMFPTVEGSDSAVKTWNLDVQDLQLSSTVKSLQSMLESLSSLIDSAPPDTGPRRFGNVAFRKWYQLAEEEVPRLLDVLMTNHVSSVGQQRDSLRQELQPYLLGSFGSAQRLDYGTGHELSFLAFLGCLWKLSAFQEGEERAIVIHVIQPYLVLVRKLIMTYTLEPAGSHGVWGLDDHSFVPYILGSAQFGPPISNESQPTPTEGSLSTAPSPGTVTSKSAVATYKDSNMYISAIQFIYDVKKGPFWEHSPILYDISGIKDGWGKINKGMMKMYAAEVLGKFPVVQHFPFGSLFRWENDPAAVVNGTSIHTQQQPRSKDTMVPPPQNVGSGGGSVGTQAPWAKTRNTGVPMPQMQAATGVPTMRAPWATNPAGAAGGSSQSPAGRNMPTTRAPWGSTNLPPSSGIPSRGEQGPGRR